MSDEKKIINLGKGQTFYEALPKREVSQVCSNDESNFPTNNNWEMELGWIRALMFDVSFLRLNIMWWMDTGWAGVGELE